MATVKSKTSQEYIDSQKELLSTLEASCEAKCKEVEDIRVQIQNTEKNITAAEHLKVNG